MNVLRGIYGFFYERREHRRDEKARQAAMTTPPKLLFNPSGWDPLPATQRIAAPYVGPLYPEPSYDQYSPRKQFHKVKPEAVKLCNEAREAWAAKKFDVAQAAYQRAVDVCPRVPDFSFEQAHLLWSQGRLDEAQAKLDEALERDSAFGSAHASRLLIQAERHDFPEVCADFHRFSACTRDFGQGSVIGQRVRSYRQ